MPRLVKSTPKYRKHRASGQAIVTIEGRDFYLGPHGTKASHLEYDRIISEWLANGRRLPVEETEAATTVVELIAAYLKHARAYYRKDGKPTSEVAGIKAAARFVRQMYGGIPASEFGPLKLKAVRQQMLDTGWHRGTINQQTKRIVRMFRWGAENELVPGSVVANLRTSLDYGKATPRPENPSQSCQWTSQR